MESRRQTRMVEEENLRRKERKRNGGGNQNVTDEKVKVEPPTSVFGNGQKHRKETRRQRFRRIMLELYDKVKEPENGYDSFCFHFNQ